MQREVSLFFFLVVYFNGFIISTPFCLKSFSFSVIMVVMLFSFIVSVIRASQKWVFLSADVFIALNTVWWS